MVTAETGGDLLLYTLTAWRSASPRAFRQASDALLPAAEDGSGFYARHARAAAGRALLTLGHCDRLADGSLAVGPPQLSELPAAGMPQAVLQGARTPDTTALLHAAAAREGASIACSEQALAPSRLALTASDRSVLRAVAAAAGVGYAAAPGAWTALQQSSETLHTVESSLSWSGSPELNWPRRDFDTASCRFKAPAEADTGERRLSSYLDPTTNQVRHALWRGQRSAQCDRDWGRHIALYHRRITVLRYSQEHRAALSPATAPLPLPLARALTLCSGQLPETHAAQSEDQPPQQVFRWVPPDVFAEVQRRLAPNR